MEMREDAGDALRGTSFEKFPSNSLQELESKRLGQFTDCMRNFDCLSWTAEDVGPYRFKKISA